MRRSTIVLGALLLCMRYSTCRGEKIVRFGPADHRHGNPPNFGTWTRPSIRPPPPTVPPALPPRTTPHYEVPARIEQCQQPLANDILNLTGTGLTQIGQAFVQSTHVREVYLDYNSITDISPMAFNDLPRLEVLSLIGNKLSVSRFLWFKEHSALRKLIIDDNTRKEKSPIINEILQPLPRLKQLFLRRDGIIDLSINLKMFAPELELLDLSGNEMRSIDFLENAPKTMIDLRLDDNQFQRIGDDFLSNVEALSVSGNSIAELCGATTCSSDSSLTLSGMTKLKMLNVSRNSINIVAEDAFENATGLTVLDLSDNKLATLPSNMFHGLQAMHELRLNGNQFTTVPVLCPLRRLKQLNLSHNHIAKVTAEGLCDSPSLETLLLADNYILDLDEQVFLNLRALHTLDLSSNTINVLPIDLIANARSLVNISLRKNRIINIDNLFARRFNMVKELHLEDNPLPFIKAACMPSLIVHLKHMDADFEEMYNDDDDMD